VPTVKPTFFPTPIAFRRWLERHHARAAELWVGYWKKGTGKPSITWPESVDEALCFGWIDGLRKSLGDERYMIRFSPRRPGSIWSAINIRRVHALRRTGRMRPAGLAAFARRTASRSSIYAYEQRPATLPPRYARALRARANAWAFFRSRPPGYQRRMTWWIVSAKQESTRARRLATLVTECERGRVIGLLTGPARRR